MAMDLGISSYCLSNKLYTNEMTIFDIMDYAKAHDCTHMEVVPFGLPILNDDNTPNMEFATAVREHAEKIGLFLSAFSLNAHFIYTDEDGNDLPEEDRQKAYDTELARVKNVMHVAYEMGIRTFRCDTCSGQRPGGANTPENFEKDFPYLVQATQDIADYAATLGMNTTLENHGLYVNGADRMIRILLAANRPNVGLTVDVGNYLCVDADPVTEVQKAIKYADMVHLKDFYIRPNAKMFPQRGMYTNFPKPKTVTTAADTVEKKTDEEINRRPSFGYVGTAARNTILRGAIIGQGDMDLWKIISIIKENEKDPNTKTPHVSLEFEGMEDCEAGTFYGLETARYIYDQLD